MPGTHSTLIGRGGRACKPGEDGSNVFASGQNLVYQTIRYRILSRHEVVTLGVYGDALDRLAGILGQDAVQALAQIQDFLGLDLDVAGLALGAARGLVKS